MKNGKKTGTSAVVVGTFVPKSAHIIFVCTKFSFLNTLYFCALYYFLVNRFALSKKCIEVQNVEKLKVGAHKN